MPVRGPLERRKGFADGDSVRDSSVYLDNHTLYVDVLGYGVAGGALVVRGLNTQNAPTDIFRVEKDGTFTVGVMTSPVMTSPTISTGDLVFGTTGQRITGDLSNATAANRLALQSSVVNGSTVWMIVPNGTSLVANNLMLGSSDIPNAPTLSVRHIGTTAIIDTNKLGTGTAVDLDLRAVNTTLIRLGVSGALGFFGIAGTTKPTVTGSRGANAALASLLTALAGLGLLTDSSS
jgi:hypothetical protein